MRMCGPEPQSTQHRARHLSVGWCYYLSSPPARSPPLGSGRAQASESESILETTGLGSTEKGLPMPAISCMPAPQPPSHAPGQLETSQRRSACQPRDASSSLVAVQINFPKSADLRVLVNTAQHAHCSPLLSILYPDICPSSLFLLQANGRGLGVGVLIPDPAEKAGVALETEPAQDYHYPLAL